MDRGSSRGGAARGRSGSRIFVALAAVLATMLIGTSSASAADERLDFTVDSAWVFQKYPGAPEYSGIPVLAPTQAPVELSGELNPDGSFTIPAAQFVFGGPITGAPFSASVEFAAASDPTGTYYRETGAMDLEVPMLYRMRSSVEAQDEMGCEVSGFPIAFRTSGVIDIGSSVNFEGKPFTYGAGSVLGDWSVPTSDLEIKGIDGTPDAACEATFENAPSPFAGGMWLSGGVKIVDITPPDPPVPPVPPVTTKLTFNTAKKTVKAGKAASLRLRIENTTDARRSIKVAFKSSNRRVKVKRSITVNVPPRSVFLTNVRVKALKSAKGKAKITARADGLTTVSTVTVKKAKKKAKKAKRAGAR